MLSLAQVVALNENRDITADSKQKQEVINYAKAMRWIIHHKHLLINKRNLLRLHVLIVNRLLSNEKAGRFKLKQNYVINEKKVAIYTPPSPKECPCLIEELLVWVNQNNKAHPIIQSAVFHHQLVNIHPFSDANGRLARAAALWILYKHRFDPHQIFYLDDFYAGNRRRYYQKIQQARELDYDFTYWIEYVAEGLLWAIEKVYSRIANLSYSMEKKISLTPKQEELLNLLGIQGVLGSHEICNALKINRARVNQLISVLVKANIVVREGQARAARYYLK